MLKTFVFRAVFFVLGAAMFSTPLKAEEPKAGDQSAVSSQVVSSQAVSSQIDRGRQLFRKATEGVSCTTCHAMEGTGAAVGPDLKNLGAIVGPRGLATTIMMSVTCYVQEYTPKNGASFPGIEKSKAGGMVEVWDMTTNPAQLKTFKESEVTAKANSAWKHPPTAMGLEDQELADIIAYVKTMSTGKAKEVKIEELH